MVQRLNNGIWSARRLGGSSTGLPDIVAVNNINAVLLSIEAKSGTGDILYVPPDQVGRCLMIRNMFSFYTTRHAILAFKFMNKKRYKRKGLVVYEQRKLIEYYKIADKFIKSRKLPTIKCTYDGRTFAITGNKTVELNLPDFQMPFSMVTVLPRPTEISNPGQRGRLVNIDNNKNNKIRT